MIEVNALEWKLWNQSTLGLLQPLAVRDLESVNLFSLIKSWEVYRGWNLPSPQSSGCTSASGLPAGQSGSAGDVCCSCNTYATSGTTLYLLSAHTSLHCLNIFFLQSIVIVAIPRLRVTKLNKPSRVNWTVYII